MDDGTFKVGEIAILQNLDSFSSLFNGEDVEVIGGLGQRNVSSISGTISFCVTYIVSYRGFVVAVRPSNLKKKRPPRIENAVPRELEAA